MAKLNNKMIFKIATELGIELFFHFNRKITQDRKMTNKTIYLILKACFFFSWPEKHISICCSFLWIRFLYLFWYSMRFQWLFQFYFVFHSICVCHRQYTYSTIWLPKIDAQSTFLFIQWNFFCRIHIWLATPIATQQFCFFYEEIKN